MSAKLKIDTVSGQNNMHACLCAIFELALHLIRPLFCLDSFEQALLNKRGTLIFPVAL